MYWKLKEFEAFSQRKYVVLVEVRDKKYGLIYSQYITELTNKSNLFEYVLSWKSPPEKVKAFLLVHFNKIKKEVDRLLIKEML